MFSAWSGLGRGLLFVHLQGIFSRQTYAEMLNQKHNLLGLVLESLEAHQAQCREAAAADPVSPTHR